MKGNIWQFAMLALVCALVLPAVVNGGFADAAAVASSNESTSVDYDANYSLDQSPEEVFSYKTLTAQANNTTLQNGTDYEFSRVDGEVNWLNTSETEDGDSATVEYNYTYHTETTEQNRTILSTIGAWLGIALLLPMAGIIISWFSGGGY